MSFLKSCGTHYFVEHILLWDTYSFGTHTFLGHILLQCNHLSITNYSSNLPPCLSQYTNLCPLFGGSIGKSEANVRLRMMRILSFLSSLDRHDLDSWTNLNRENLFLLNLDVTNLFLPPPLVLLRPDEKRPVLRRGV